VGAGGRCDDDRIGRGDQLADILRHPRGRELPGDALARLGIGVTHGDQLRLGHPGNGAHVVLAPRAGANHADLQATHR